MRPQSWLMGHHAAGCQDFGLGHNPVDSLISVKTLAEI